MAVDFNTGKNFVPVRMRYRLPLTKRDTSIYLLSDSYEYDIELIKQIPPPKMEYQNIIIPFRLMDRLNGRQIRFLMSTMEFNKKTQYLTNAKLTPKLIPIRYPYPKTITSNLYITISDIMNLVNQYLRNMSAVYIRKNIFNMFEQIMRHFSFSQQKIIVIDTARYPLYKTLTPTAFKNDFINALLAAFLLNPPTEIRHLKWSILFRSPECDYKFDMSTYDVRDAQLLRAMMQKIGSDKLVVNDDEEVEDSLDEIETVDDASETVFDSEVSDEEEVVSAVDDQSTTDDPDIQKLQASNRSVTRSIKSTVASLSDTFKTGESVEEVSEKETASRSLYDAKSFQINATLMKKINPDTTTVGQYDKLSEALSSSTTDQNPVEKNLVDDAAKVLATTNSASNTQNALNTISSTRELQIRGRIGTITLNKLSIDKLSSVIDIPKPIPVVPAKMSTTNPGALKGTSFARISKAYEEEMLDHDIVSTFMNLGDLPDGFIVENLEVTDVSSVVSLTNNWKVVLKQKSNGKRSTLNIRVPKVINGRFYNNGIWYNIAKQDFPIPILKIDKKTVIMTSNYNKITVSRYDTRSLVDISTLRKTIANQVKKDGANLYVKPGCSTMTNSRFVSTIEYDEFAKQWVSFTVPSSKCEVYFNRQVCGQKYSFVTVDQDEFCCGMINQVPVVLNTETGLTRAGKTLTETLVSALPPVIQAEYAKIKPGKLSMYAEITIGIKLPMGVAIAAWEGLTSLLKKSNCKYSIVDKRTPTPEGHFCIPFKDKELMIQNTITNQLVFNGFHRINTKAYEIGSFETTVMSQNSIFVDILNNIFFKQYSQLTTFITYYNFFVDVITKDVCAHYHLPTDITGMLLYAANLLADNSCTSESNAALYRIRSTEIIPAIIHYHLACAVSKYNNAVGSKNRSNSLVMNPNEVMQEILKVVEPMSSLNPIVELNTGERISKKGFRGVNNDRAYPLQKRNYDETMIGKQAISSPNNGTVGITRQLVIDPKIESVRGYTSPESMDQNYNDLQLASFSELLTPGTVTSDDAIRTAIATSQTSHIVPTIDAQPVIISNGVDELVPSCLSDEFSVVADDDGSVIEIEDGYMIIEYKSKKKRAINVADKMSFNTGSGFYVNNKLLPNFNAGDKFKKGDVLAYHERFFTKDIDGVVRMNIGPLAKVAFAGLYSTYEDAGLITNKMSKRLGTAITMKEEAKINAMDDIESLIEVGTEVEVNDPLIVFGLGDTGDKSVDNFLKAFTKSDANILDTAKRVIKAKHSGVVKSIWMNTTRPLEQLSPSLAEIFRKYFAENKKKRKVLDRHDKSDSVYKLDTLYNLPTEPLKGNTIKGIRTDVLIEIYIEHGDESSVGDKLVVYGAAKQISSEVVPEGLEPYTESEPNEEISVFVAPDSILKRMIPSLPKTAVGNRNHVELKKQLIKIWRG